MNQVVSGLVTKKGTHWRLIKATFRGLHPIWVDMFYSPWRIKDYKEDGWCYINVFASLDNITIDYYFSKYVFGLNTSY